MCKVTSVLLDNNDDITADVVNVVLSLINSHKPFTAFDITTGVRAAYPQRNVRHQRVRDFVFSEMRDNGSKYNYDMSTTRLKSSNGIVEAMVYFPVGSTPDSHPNAENQGVATPPVSNVSSTSNSVDDDVQNFTKENRINIPRPMIKDIGLLAGKDAEIVQDNTQIKIIPAVHSHCVGMKNIVKVNADGRIRLSKTVLSEYFSPLPAAFKITHPANTTEILISAN